MKFIHTADLHMDRNFEGLGAIPKELEQRLVAANEQVWRALTDLAIAEQVDCLLLAGDTFHRPKPTIRMQAVFTTQLERLQAAGIPVFLCSGNHDFADQQRFWFALPDNVSFYNQETIATHCWTTAAGERVAISSFGYEHRWLDGKAADFPKRYQDVDFHIGMYHGERRNPTGSTEQLYAPFSLEQLNACGYDYWALGHIHVPQILQNQPLTVYPGTPQGHVRKEQQLKGVALIETNVTKNLHLSWHSLAKVCWQTLPISLVSCRRRADVEGLFTTVLQKAAAENAATLLLVNIEISGLETGIFGTEANEITNELAQWLEYLQTTFYEAHQGNIWVYELKEQLSGLHNGILQLISGVDSSLLQRLAQTYLNPEYFATVIEELYQVPQLTNHLQLDEQFRTAVIQQAEKLLLTGEEGAVRK